MSATSPSAQAGEPFRMSQVGRHTLVYGAGILLAKAVSFVMLPIYTRFLTPSDYGVMELIEMTLDVVAILAGARVAVGIFRYYHKASSDAERDAVISTALMVLAGSYGLIGILTFLAAEPLSEWVFQTSQHTLLIRLAAGSLACSSLMIAPLTYLRVRERSLLFVLSQLVQVILQVGLNLLLLVHFELGVQAVFISGLVSKLVVGLALTGYLVSQVGLRFSRSSTKDLLRYGIPLIGMELATFIATFSSRYFLNAAADIATVGIYGLAYQFGFLVAAIGYLPFEMIWEPIRFSVAKRADRHELYARAFIYLNLMLVTTALAITLFAGDVVRMMTTPAFYPAAQFVPVIVVAYVLQGWVGLQDVGIHIRERTEWITLANWASAITALVGYAIFIPRYYAMGAAVVTVVAFAVRYFGCYWISQWLWPVEYRWGPVLRLLGLAVGVAAIGLSLPDLDLLASLAARSGLMLLYAGGVLSLAVLSAEEKARLFESLRSVLGAVRRGAAGAGGS